MPYIDPPPKTEIERLYNVEQLSVKSIAAKYGVSGETIKVWMDSFGLKRRTKKEASAISTSRMTQERLRKMKDAALDIPQDEAHSAMNSKLALLDTPNAQPLQNLEADGEDPWSRLSRQQREACALLAELGAKELTNVEISQQVGCTPTTVGIWRKNPDFSYCLLTMRKAKMHHELTILWSNDMYNRYLTGKTSSDDRKLTADVLGLVDDRPTVNITVNVKDSFGFK